MKKVYFACSIRGGRDDAEIYGNLVTVVKKYAEVLTEIFADKKLTVAGMDKPAGDIWSNDVRWIGQADALIAEVTNPSLGVGYEIAKAQEMGKPILCLFRPEGERKLSAMIAGSPSATIFEYSTPTSAEHAISTFLSTIRSRQTT
ncbi:MAG: nucleoside 2-deoxyribosyltransferase [Candidatus Saccharibacteria bacterium]|nr:nucleoside 2-deoxyribosyltransferase [Candidatus Saccharibacteria bacterium]